MRKVSRILTLPAAPLIIVSILAWGLGSTYWYVCKTQELCSASESVANEQPSQTDDDSIAQIVNEDGETVSFDTTRTITIYFDPDVAAPVDDTWQSELDVLATYLAANPDKKATISGYTAVFYVGPDVEELATERAEKIQQYLLSKGVDGKQIELIVEGSKDPVGDNSTRAGRAKNRRATVKINQEEV